MRTRVCVALIAAVLSAAVRASADVPAPLASGAASCAVPNAPAQIVHAVTPQTPPLALEQQAGGTVEVTVRLDAQSHVTLAQIAVSPSPLLDSAALAAARASSFATEIRNCVPIASLLRMPMVFPRPDATGPLPAIAGDFLGTWSCESDRSAAVVNAFGRNRFDGPVMVLIGAFVSTDESVTSNVERFSERGGVTTVSDGYAGRLFIGTAHGWDGNRLVFRGVSSAQQTMDPMPLSATPLFERLTFVRSDSAHFTRTFETHGQADGPWTTRSRDTCVRIAAAS